MNDHILKSLKNFLQMQFIICHQLYVWWLTAGIGLTHNFELRVNLYTRLTCKSQFTTMKIIYTVI